MKKGEIICRRYGGVKERHGVEITILLYVGDPPEAYLDDAEAIIRVTEVLRFETTAAGIPVIKISDVVLKECRDRLLDAGRKVCMPGARGAPGRHVPKTNETSTEADR